MIRDFVRTIILCRCGSDLDLCVPVSLAVPRPLQCRPGGSIAPADGVARSDICCRPCRRSLFHNDAALIDRVESELRRGRGTHVHAGAVIIDCR